MFSPKIACAQSQHPRTDLKNLCDKDCFLFEKNLAKKFSTIFHMNFKINFREQISSHMSCANIFSWSRYIHRVPKCDPSNILRLCRWTDTSRTYFSPLRWLLANNKKNSLQLSQSLRVLVLCATTKNQNFPAFPNRRHFIQKQIFNSFKVLWKQEDVT
jgi:hypothetical protein